MGRAGNMAFKQVQWLPTLTSELLVNTRTKSEVNLCPITKPTPAAKCGRAQAESACLRLPTTSFPVSERVVFAIVGLSAAVAAGQALMTMISPVPDWPLLGKLVGVLFG